LGTCTPDRALAARRIVDDDKGKSDREALTNAPPPLLKRRDELGQKSMASADERIARKRDWLRKIADHAAKLLNEESSAPAQMQWAEQRLSEVIAQNLDLMDDSIPWMKERDSHPEKAETFEELILQLIPS
jgi:hypothetical protein